MDARAADLPVYGFALATLGHAAFALYVVRSGFLRRAGGSSSAAFMVAIVCSTFWAGFALLDQYTRGTWPAYAAACFDLLRYGAWFAFLLLLLRLQPGLPSEGESRVLLPSAALLLLLATVALGWRMAAGVYLADDSKTALASSLALSVFGLLLTEQLFRNLPEDSRWNAKPVCLGLACIFIFDVYLYSEALLFGRFDHDAQSIRGAVHLLSVPLLFVRRIGRVTGFALCRSLEPQPFIRPPWCLPERICCSWQQSATTCASSAAIGAARCSWACSFRAWRSWCCWRFQVRCARGSGSSSASIFSATAMTTGRSG